jgi:transcriptional regulator with XRE-family HTH domain
MRGMITIDRERLKAVIAERQTTARAVSRAVGDNDTLVRDILSGKSRNPRSDTLAKIADFLEVPVREFVTGADATPAEAQERFAELPLLGPVQAGAWLMIDDTSQEEPETYPAAHDRRYPQARQWLREVQGDSMNARNIFPGNIAHIVELIGSGVNLNTGMIVEVTRTRDGGSLREITLKEVEITDQGKVLLWPRSTNPRWKDPVRLDDGASGDLEVEITGLLLATITRF